MPRFRSRRFGRKKRFYKKKTSFSRKKRYSKKRYTRRYRKKRTKSITVWRRLSNTIYGGPTNGYNWGQQGPLSPPANEVLNVSNIADWASFYHNWNRYKVQKAMSIWLVEGSHLETINDPIAYNGGTGIYTVASSQMSFAQVAGYRDPDGYRTAVDWPTLLDKGKNVFVKTMYPGRKISMAWKPFYRIGIGGTGYLPKRGYLPTDYGAAEWRGFVWDWNNPPYFKDYSNINIIYEIWVKITFKDLNTGKIHVAPQN